MTLWAALGESDLDQAAEVAAQIWVDGPASTPEQVDPGVRHRFKDMARTELKIMLPGATQPDGLEPPALGRFSKIIAPTLVVLGDLDDPGI